MAESTPVRGRIVGRSTTTPGDRGTPLRLADPLDRAYLCQKMCGCDAGSALVSASGQVLKQRCVTARIWTDEEVNQLVWRYKAEVGYSMKANPPAPLMSARQPNRPSRFPLGAAMGQGVLKRSLEGTMQRGLLRIPDCIILKVTWQELEAMRAAQAIDWARLMPVRTNIETVLEIKFPGDQLKPWQQQDYIRIAGPDHFRLLEMSDCDCARKRAEPLQQPVRVPVVTPLRDAQARRLFGPKPEIFPAPETVRPYYSPVINNDEVTPLSRFLKTAAVTAGVILVGAIVIAALPVEGVVAGVSLAVVGGAAVARPIVKKGRK